ncbi:hypothetical protein [Alkalimarinus coralli]|uniref:hypothetical protein n=1 Tax=Alkalimarinus coralli TaxID=2935863 RepID=UPI00202B98E7|nr:hypothetical protein [Alkalimarinus coralli]
MIVGQNPSPIKSVQRGTVSGAGVVNISSVDVSKSILILNGRGYGITYQQNYYGIGGGWTGVLSTSTITIDCDATIQAGATWQVIEYV